MSQNDNYSYQTNQQQNQTPLFIQFTSNRNQKYGKFSQDGYINEESTFPFIFDGDIPSKVSQTLIDNETRSSIQASTSFELDQEVEQNPLNLFELEQLSRANSEFYSLNNFHYNLYQNLEYPQYEQDYFGTNQPVCFEQKENTEQLLPILDQCQKEQEHCYKQEDRISQYGYSNNYEFYNQCNNLNLNDNITHYSFNLENNNIQNPMNSQLKQIGKNINQFSTNHQQNILNNSQDFQNEQKILNQEQSTNQQNTIEDLHQIETGFNYYEYYRTQQQQNEQNQIRDNINNNSNINKFYFKNEPYFIEKINNQNNQFQKQIHDESSSHQGQYSFSRENQVIIKNTPIQQKDSENQNINSQQISIKQMLKNNITENSTLYYNSELNDEEEVKMTNNKDTSHLNKKQSIDYCSSTSAALTCEEEIIAKKEEQEDYQILQKIEEMKVCNKKNVVKNIMNAFKNFILEAELKNTPKINQNIEDLYNNSKTDNCDSLQEIIKKFKRYINSKNFNHYSMRLVIIHPNYGPVLQYFLKGPIQDWANSCKANDLASHFVMADFLLLCFSDIKYIDELKRHEKKKAHYQ